MKNKEILYLEKYCKKIGVKTSLEFCLDGYVIRFLNGDDFAQHSGTYGSDMGCVEFCGVASKNYSYKAKSLTSAKRFVKRHKDKLNAKE